MAQAVGGVLVGGEGGKGGVVRSVGGERARVVEGRRARVRGRREVRILVVGGGGVGFRVGDRLGFEGRLL